VLLSGTFLTKRVTMRTKYLTILTYITITGIALAHELEVPKVLESPAPMWPMGHHEHHDVVVPVVAVIGEDGSVESASVETSVGHGFDEAALGAVRTWKFKPGSRDGKPIAAKIRVAVRFIGEDDDDDDDHGDSKAHPPHDAAHAGTHAPAQAEPAAEPPPKPPEPERVRVVGPEAARSASEVRRGRDVLGATPHRTASDLLNVIPGVFVTQHSGEGKAHQIFMRGFDAIHGQDVEVWIGGMPVNEPSHIHGQGYADLHFVMPEVVKEVQAIGGPFDPRQGDFAVAGTIRMKLALTEPGFTVKGTLGSYGARRLFLGYHPKGSSDETFAAFEEYKTDGFGPSRSARRGSLIAQGTHDFGSDLSLRVLGTLSSGRYDSAGTVRAVDIDRGVDRFAPPGTAEAPFGPQGGSSARGQLLFELHKDEEGGRWSLSPFLIARSTSLRQNFTGFLVDPVRGDNNEQVNDSTTLGLTASYKRKVSLLGEDDAIEAGLFARHDMIEQSQRRFGVDGPVSATLVDAKVRATNVAGYLDASVHPLRRLVLRGGLRLDALAYAVDDNVEPQLGRRTAQGSNLGKKLTADYAVGGSTHLLASYGDGFRSPQARALANGESAPFTTVRAVEVGARMNDGKRVSGSLSAYYTHLSQDLVFDPETARNETAPGTGRIGASAEAVLRPASWLTVSASATYTRASFREDGKIGGTDVRAGDLLPYVPQWVSRVDTGAKRVLTSLWNRPLEGRVGVALESFARRPLPFSEFGRDVFLVDTSVGVRLREVELSIDVTNLLDAQWFDGQFVYVSRFGGAQSRIPTAHVTAGPPRMLFGNVTLYL
jgi:iron complex outermembrane recepter protein